LPVTNGFVGLSLLKKLKQEKSMSKELSPSSRKGSDGRAVGPDARIGKTDTCF
jgi:hypothetical protein